jgi:ABC-type uncharacterized transport system substrate-binding protein
MTENRPSQSEFNQTPTGVWSRLLLFLLFLVMSVVTACGARPDLPPNPQPAEAVDNSNGEGALRILHVMSYHSPWAWTDDQLAGFKDGLGSDVKADFEVIQMDTKRQNSEAWLKQIAGETDEVIDTWQPDLIYLNDDVAQKYVGQNYVNTGIPIVFSGVNADPAEYGYSGSGNVTGVLEQEHYLASLHLLLDIVPDVKRIAAVIVDDPTWAGVVKRMKDQAHNLPPGVEIVRWDKFLTYADYQQAIAEYQTEVDAIALLGVFTFKDERGDNVPFEEVLQWTAENSNLPDFSFWDSRIPYGTLAVVTVSGYEQGFAAGKMARQILVDGDSPAGIDMAPTVKGRPMINLARAQQLGLTVDSTLLLSSDVVNHYTWQE